jgi:hypothetical protein
MSESKKYYTGLNKKKRYSSAEIQQIVTVLNQGRVGAQVDEYTKNVHATNMGLAKLVVFPDNSGIFFKENGPFTNEYILEAHVANISRAIDSAKESGKIDKIYQYKNSAGVLVGGNRRKISRRNSRRKSIRSKSRK